MSVDRKPGSSLKSMSNMVVYISLSSLRHLAVSCARVPPRDQVGLSELLHLPFPASRSRFHLISCTTVSPFVLASCTCRGNGLTCPYPNTGITPSSYISSCSPVRSTSVQYSCNLLSPWLQHFMSTIPVFACSKFLKESLSLPPSFFPCAPARHQLPEAEPPSLGARTAPPRLCPLPRTTLPSPPFSCTDTASCVEILSTFLKRIPLTSQ